ncbi:FGGY family carbohydrate kinase [Nitratireductor basaltis]|uniref:Glycerol kinase n=1 Tax=Nitratireductor basaltis TaxID=472175 RepID=A0A084U8M0_9HYPH|nr:FGGY family carbohydrate kinase [Nitratireductor basaltis]KFB09306.1 Glycerol kinase [Nitratireductor basaltis]
MRLAGIDQGTTSTRALATRADGSIEVVHSASHKQYYPRDGWVEHDPEELIANIRKCADAVSDADALGIDNQGESCIAWDARSKEALSPVIVWQDSRTLQALERLREDGFEAETLERAGLPMDPYFSASKLGWIVNNVPAAREARKNGTLRLGTTDAFFLDRLTGTFATDVSTASRTSLMNLRTLEWDPVLCDLFGVPIECLPPIRSTTGDFGALGTAAGHLPVTASVVDQQAALYGFGCRQKGDAKITFGTGAFALMVTGEEIIRRPDLGLLPTVGWQLQGSDAVYALDGGVFTASAAVNWAKSLGLFSDFAKIDTFGNNSAAEGGLFFVPALAGLGCPYWQPRARGLWSGLSLEHGPDVMVQSILEGVALRSCQVMEAMDRCVPLAHGICIDGGMSRNTYFTQFLADVSGRTISPAIMPEVTGLGTICLAGDAPGIAYDAAVPCGSIQPKRDLRHLLPRFADIVSLSLKGSRDLSSG